jgi:hypothetical protein
MSLSTLTLVKIKMPTKNEIKATRNKRRWYEFVFPDFVPASERYMFRRERDPSEIIKKWK